MRDPKVTMWFNAKSWSSMTPLNSSSSNRGKPVQDWGGGYHMVITFHEVGYGAHMEVSIVMVVPQ